MTQRNQGAAAARNKAFSLSQGDYIQWLDADDLLDPDKIAKQVDALASCPSRRTLLSSAWGHFIHRPDHAKFIATGLWCDLAPMEWLLRKWEQNIFMQTATWLVSRELTEAAGPWNTRLLGDDDGEYFCRVILASDGIRFVPNARMFYRRVPPNRRLSHVGISTEKAEAHFLSMQLQIRHIRAAADSARVRAACLKYLQSDSSHFYPERPDMFKQAEQLAADLGGRLQAPQLPLKYAWIQRLFGWAAAKRTQVHYNQCKSSVITAWDAALFHLGI